MCILRLILQIKKTYCLSFMDFLLLFFLCPDFTWYLQAYWIMSNWLNRFWKPTELYFFFVNFVTCCLIPPFSIYICTFSHSFFSVDIFDRYKMQMIQFKKNKNKWQDNWFVCILTLFRMSQLIDINLYIIIFCYTFARNRYKVEIRSKNSCFNYKKVHQVQGKGLKNVV